jgi:CheY-like chemotaxis protein
MNGTILVLDDDPDFLIWAERVATGLDYQTRLLSSAEEALQVLLHNEAAYAVVLFDVHMPKMDGIAFLQGIRDSSLSPPLLVAVTGQADRDVVTSLAKLEVDGVLVKPITADSLNECLERARSRRADRDFAKVMGSIETKDR